MSWPIKQMTQRVKIAAAADHDIAYWLAPLISSRPAGESARMAARTAISLGNENYKWFESDPNWADLHDDPRFKELMERCESSAAKTQRKPLNENFRGRRHSRPLRPAS